MSYAIPVEVYEAIRKVVKDEELAKEVVKTIEKSLTAIEEKAKEQKIVIKAELKDELRSELVTKDEFFGEIGKLRQEMKTLRQEIEAVRQELRRERRALEEKMKRWLPILGFLIVLMNQNTVTFLLKVFGVLK
jgi:hypothetical protein